MAVLKYFYRLFSRFAPGRRRRRALGFRRSLKLESLELRALPSAPGLSIGNSHVGGPLAQATNQGIVAQPLAQLPLSFAVNEGQTDAEVRYFTRGPGYDLFLTGTGAVLN